MVNKWEWSRLFRQAHDKSFSIANIVSGFRKCGIYPVDRNAIPKTALAPSVPFDVQLTTNNITTPAGVDNVVAQQPDPRYYHTEVLETAHDGTVLNETELIGLVTSGQYPCTVDPVSGNLEITLELFNGQPMQQSGERRPFVHDWSVVVDQEFALLTSERTTGMEKPSSRKLTSHRILTSDEIVKKKREDKEKKKGSSKKKKIANWLGRLKKRTPKQNKINCVKKHNNCMTLETSLIALCIFPITVGITVSLIQCLCQTVKSVPYLINGNTRCPKFTKCFFTILYIVID
ncbi:hypothetical protein DPMN_154351 [Dreissena polymorpha]|uniref:Uncharacterized protein n=1 Tax=Dreissena polymorpha TaxID=45954 RepID=A0A9D4FPS0_DREPO|nr:hypothetical protein DPMN_154351 [Dreissena polymorpha]